MFLGGARRLELSPCNTYPSNCSTSTNTATPHERPMHIKCTPQEPLAATIKVHGTPLPGPLPGAAITGEWGPAIHLCGCSKHIQPLCSDASESDFNGLLVLGAVGDLTYRYKSLHSAQSRQKESQLWMVTESGITEGVTLARLDGHYTHAASHGRSSPRRRCVCAWMVRTSLGSLFQPMFLPEASAPASGRPRTRISTGSPFWPLGS